jgi:hypothetical protein
MLKIRTLNIFSQISNIPLNKDVEKCIFYWLDLYELRQSKIVCKFYQIDSIKSRKIRKDIQNYQISFP